MVSTLNTILGGTAVALKLGGDVVARLEDWISQLDGLQEPLPSLTEWLATASTLEEPDSLALARLVLVIAYLDYHGPKLTSDELAHVWKTVFDALSSSVSGAAASRSAQGFLAVPLCSLLDKGQIDQLWRLHVWLPYDQRGQPEFGVHSHQAFAQSWVLAGKGVDRTYSVEDVDAGHPERATHARYRLSWAAGGASDTKYKTHQTSSTIENTNELVRLTLRTTRANPRNTTYTIPEAVFHTSEVPSNALHATLFVFDARRGFVRDAGVLGPVDRQTYTQFRDPAGFVPGALVQLVHAFRAWEDAIANGRIHAMHAEWEDALQDFNQALSICDALEKALPDRPKFHRYLTLGELGKTNRRFGRYRAARDLLEAALGGMGRMESCEERVDLLGELGVVRRQSDMLIEAKKAFQEQYDEAQDISSETDMCRALGNLGMVNYQLWSEQDHDQKLLELAVQQLTERVERARKLKHVVWEIIGHTRLSLCHAAAGRNREAVEAAMEGLKLAETCRDPTVLAMTRFYYGRALLRDGRREEAAQQFNPLHTCTPAMAFCKEPSAEHRGYLAELVESKVDLDLVDEQGYTALDYAVFSGDSQTEGIIVGGIRQALAGTGADGRIEAQIDARLRESRARKGYRQVFQEILRPALLAASDNRTDGAAAESGDGNDAVRRLRRAYAEVLASDDEKRALFDPFKYVRYTDFRAFGRLPGWKDGLTRPMSPPEDEQQQQVDFVIFFSYRWIHKLSTTTSDTSAVPGESTVTPDDAENTQYRRMVQAAETLLSVHPSLDPSKLGIWLDFSCINQADPLPGILALPMVVAQCDALVSLVDAEYHERAWCAVEVMFATTLRRSYGVHQWYQQVVDPTTMAAAMAAGAAQPGYVLREGPPDAIVSPAGKQLSFEEKDRAAVNFLERQCRLLALE
ncbi:hypothetical protein GGR56DRAFT_624740 [Xylariaceae sp. FL0804]|nr:hypothetical protein GGR56DRAFT_624740 [Xylariaceae sp. FL0804]